MGNPYAPKPPGSPGPDPRRHDRPLPPAPAPHDSHRGTTDLVDPALDRALGPVPPDAQGQPGPVPPGRPPAPPVDPDAARQATRSVMHFGLLMLATLLTSSLAVPWRLVSVALALVAIVVGVRTLRRIWRAGLRGFLLVAMSAGMIMTAALALTTLAVIPVWQIEMDRQSCLAGAITISATTTCESDYRTAITQYQDSLRDR